MSNEEVNVSYTTAFNSFMNNTNYLSKLENVWTDLKKVRHTTEFICKLERKRRSWKVLSIRLFHGDTFSLMD
jgi:hypothetical protein